MKLCFLLITACFCIKSYSQIKAFYDVTPNWNKANPNTIKVEKIKSDSVFYYKKRKNNKDSSLIMTQYFDSSGNSIERDQYNFNGDVVKISNYKYADTFLMKEEEISKQFFYANGSDLSKKIKRYYYDSVGNAIIEQEDSFFGDSLQNLSVNIVNKEYDSLGYLKREFLKLPYGEKYLYHVYFYTNGNLSEIKTYDINQSWMYSYIYEYDQQLNSKSIYEYNNVKFLTHEFFYDTRKKLIMEKVYVRGHHFLDHTTQTYSYNSNGLPESQTFQDLNGKYYYYKSFYSK